MTNDGEVGERITTTWPGREIGVHYPRGRPHAFRFTSDLGEGGRGLWAISGVYHLPQNVRDVNSRLDTLDSMAAVPGRVVAVLKSVSTDEDGHTSTNLMPVVAFTRRPGRLHPGRRGPTSFSEAGHRHRCPCPCRRGGGGRRGSGHGVTRGGVARKHFTSGSGRCTACDGPNTGRVARGAGPR